MHSHLSCFCLNMSLFCPPHSTSLLSFLTTKPQFDMQVLALALSQTILDCSRESASLSAWYNFLTAYIIHVCLSQCVCVCERDREQRVKRLGLLLMRITEPTERKTRQQSQQHCHKYHLAPALTLVLQQKHIQAQVVPVSTWVEIKNNKTITVVLFRRN